ncbi:MAG: hypothetical protein HYR91_14910 [Flavobacteriia bacterium]|nr:hypothetical protein [Flavobacteriia bacterium]
MNKSNITFIFFIFIVLNVKAQKNSQLSNAYRKLKDTYINLSNNAVPFKLNGKWGIKSFEGEIIYKATLDSIYSLTTKKSLIQNCFLAKERNLYKIIDCNGNVLFGKTFDKMNITQTYFRDNLYLCDSLNSYHIEIDLNQITVEYFDKTHFSNNMDHLRIAPKFVNYHFFFDVAKKSTGYLIYDTITKNHLLTCYSSNIRTYEHEITSLKYINLDKENVLNYATSNKYISYFHSSNKFYDSDEWYNIFTIKTKDCDYLIIKKNSIEFINKNGELISEIEGEYNMTYQDGSDRGKRIFTITKNNRQYYKILNCETRSFYDQDFESLQNFKGFFVTTDSTNLNIVYNDELKEILRDTNVIFNYFNPSNEISVLISYKNHIWKGYDTLGNLIGGIYSYLAKTAVQENGIMKIGSYEKSFFDMKVEAFGIYINGKIFFIRELNELSILNSNAYFLDKDDEDILMDSTGKTLLKLPYLNIVKTGNNFILETSHYKGEYFQIDSKLQKIISKNFCVSVQDLTNRPVESPFIIYHTNTAKNNFGGLDQNKNIYGLMDENYKIIQAPSFKIIIAVNKNFIVVDENYNIGYLDHKGVKLY